MRVWDEDVPPPPRAGVHGAGEQAIRNREITIGHDGVVRGFETTEAVVPNRPVEGGEVPVDVPEYGASWKANGGGSFAGHRRVGCVGCSSMKGELQ